ncbi:AbrB family transcriptional regulator [uncultured Shimia sp.]|uniref:AbrB family transcriptional regulator n=1 Tax=uncultured Shimia sp. TaxID=573152 RepID=UPI0026105F27|nr:AbrB family transcriptional regulator [uncultured Shimia sp.]
MFDLALSVLVKLAVGFVGGVIAWQLGLPMPFLTGALFITAAVALSRSNTPKTATSFPRIIRQSFTAIIGVMIGQNFSPELFGILDTLWLSLGAILIFVILSHGIGFVIYRYLGRYDRETAIFASVPGGLIEAITFAEQSGAKVNIVTVQHFARVILVITIVPLLFFAWTGEVVGSAAGVEMAGASYSLWDIALTVVVAGVGMVVGKRLKLPAAILIGPLILSAGLQLSGVLPAHAPTWLLTAAQLVVGVGLGAEFQGIGRAQLVRSLGLGLVAMVAYLLLALGFAAALVVVVDIPFSALFLSFAPGGVTEMSLVALSLNVGPIIVATHHVFRISVTVVMMTFLVKRLGLTSSKT